MMCRLLINSQLHECIGSAVDAMGPETFLSIIPLKLEVGDLAEANVWVLPILKHYTVGAHLSFFKESILNMVTLMKQKSRMVLISPQWWKFVWYLLYGIISNSILLTAWARGTNCFVKELWCTCVLSMVFVAFILQLPSGYCWKL